MVLEAIEPDNPESIAQSIIPVMDREDKNRYLALRACGLSVREAVRLIPSYGKDGHLTEATVRNWRNDDLDFSDAETNIKVYRDELSKEYLNFEFTRNFTLVLHKDFNILDKSINNPHQMSDDDQKYLRSIRSQYTPQQFALLQQLLTKQSNELSFTEMVLRLSRTREVIEIEGKTK